MTIDLKSCTAEELWKYVSWHLSQYGLNVVLVGGGVVSVYTRGLYTSGDLDMVILEFFRDQLEPAMKKIGFLKKGRHFIHPACKHMFVEFPPGPLGIGDDTHIVPSEQKENGTVFRILSPTDCIRDRLANYAWGGARDCLDQAVLVAKHHMFDQQQVKRWCQKVGILYAFTEFLKGLR